MASCIIVGGGSGGALSSDVTAAKANVLAGTRTITTDSGNAVVEGTMVNRGTVNYSMPINGSFTIQQGYHSGSGKVSQSIATKAAATYYAGTSDQTIASGQYLSGVQTIKKLTQTNLTASNIRNGTTVSINNGNANVYSVTGTLESPNRNYSALAYKGFNINSSEWQTSEEETYTMPNKGHVYFGMIAMAYGTGANVVCEISVNNVVKYDCNITNWNYSWRNYSPGNFAVNKNDVVKIKVSVSGGSHVMAFIQESIAC